MNFQSPVNLVSNRFIGRWPVPANCPLVLLTEHGRAVCLSRLGGTRRNGLRPRIVHGPENGLSRAITLFNVGADSAVAQD